MNEIEEVGEVVVHRLSPFLGEEGAILWLSVPQPLMAWRTPAEMIAEGQVEEVLALANQLLRLLF